MELGEMLKLGAQAFIGSIFGACGMAIIVKRYIEKWLNKKDEEEERRRKNKIEKAQLLDELQHAQGRLIFWIYSSITKSNHESNLNESWQEYCEAEKKMKEYNRKIVAENETNE